MNKVLRTPMQTKNSLARRSQRRLNKLLEKNISQFEIPNPYRNNRSHICLPQYLIKQLSKFDCLSVRNLQGLHFTNPLIQQQVNQLLMKMRSAVQKQSQQLNLYVSQMNQKIKQQTQIAQKQAIQRAQNKILQPAQISEGQSLQKQPKGENQEIGEPQEFVNLPLVSRQSQGVSMMSDNYEQDKLVFHTYRHLIIGHQAEEHQQVSQSYQM